VNDFISVMVFGVSEFQKLLIYWDFHAQPSSIGFTENGQSSEKNDQTELR